MLITWPIFLLQFGVESRLEDCHNARVTFGCHPHFADRFNVGREFHLLKLLQKTNCVALGEIGLDYSHKNTVHKTIQMRVFQRQLRIGLSMNIPICLHIRDAIEDGFRGLKEVWIEWSRIIWAESIVSFRPEFPKTIVFTFIVLLENGENVKDGSGNIQTAKSD